MSDQPTRCFVLGVSGPAYHDAATGGYASGRASQDTPDTPPASAEVGIEVGIEEAVEAEDKLPDSLCEQLRSLPNFVTVNEAAEFLSVCGNSVRKLIRSGDLPSFRMSAGARAKLLIPRDGLGTWLKSRMINSATLGSNNS